MEVEKGRKLGLVIRGGREYGLGIFISGIDRGSTSEQKGLSVGDQILSVNGHDFRHISHENAVEILRRSSMLNIHLRQMNKLPLPKHSSDPPRTSIKLFSSRSFSFPLFDRSFVRSFVSVELDRRRNGRANRFDGTNSKRNFVLSSPIRRKKLISAPR